MKTTRYRFEQLVQEVTEDKIDWLRDEFRAILESDKDFTRKADYIGFSILSIDSKVSSIDEEIKELQQLKKNLKSAKNIAISIGGQVLQEYGIDKLEGAGISSLTLTKNTTNQFYTIDVNDEDEVIKAGYYHKEVDEDKLLSDFQGGYNIDFIKKYCTVTNNVIIKQEQLKVNKRRSSSNQLAVAS